MFDKFCDYNFKYGCSVVVVSFVLFCDVCEKGVCWFRFFLYYMYDFIYCLKFIVDIII